MRPIWFCLALMAAGCTTPPAGRQLLRPGTGAIAAADSWRTMASDADRAAVDGLPQRWRQAIAAVPKRLARQLGDEGALLDPDAAQPVPALPVGPYHCRLVRLGGRAGLVRYKPDFCYVDGDSSRRSFTKQTGDNLPGGWLYADAAAPARELFLGAMRNRPDQPAPPYTGNGPRDVIGVVERVSPFRWRLVLPRAGKGALLDVYELVPVTPDVPGAPAAVPARK